MARINHDPALTYAYCTTMFAHRKKNSDFKRFGPDCRLYDRGTHFEVMHNLWQGWDNSSGRYVRQTKPVPLATITPDNIVTLTFTEEPDQTVCNRMTQICGKAVGLNKRDYRNYEQHVRVYAGRDWRETLPYFPGMQFQHGKILNAKPDVKKVIDPAKVLQARREFDTLRKLCRTSVRMGAFDEFAHEYLSERWRIPVKDVRQLEDININDPSFDDALALIHHGGHNTTRPDTTRYNPTTKTYERIDPHIVKQNWLTRCVENGFKQLRKQFYETNDGFLSVQLQR